LRRACQAALALLADHPGRPADPYRGPQCPPSRAEPGNRGPLHPHSTRARGLSYFRIGVKNATKTIPIVMASDGDPVGNRFVGSLARPGGNITGLTNLLAGLSGKRLEVLRDAIPGTSRFGIIWNPENWASITGFKETQVAAHSLGVQLQSLEVRGPHDFESAFQA